MANQAIVEAILIIVGISIAAALAGAVIQRISTIDSALANIAQRERIYGMMSARLVHVACINSTFFAAYIKNTGSIEINMSLVDILIGKPGNEVPLWSIGGSASYSTQILAPGQLAAINISIPSPISTSIISIRAVYPNGYSDFKTCSI
jgi:archaellum component FlaG (FlaF/FlaG flagellin family)